MAETGPGARGFIIAAPSSGSGKTTVTLGLIGALKRRGFNVNVAKVGPDYIDPKFLEAASSGACINLDPWAMAPDQLRARLAAHASGCDVIIVEGVMGLFDGAEGGGGATADLAAILDLPIVLVVDASRQAQSIAALVHGFASFHPGIDVVATIATRVGSDRHDAMIAAALEPLPLSYLGSIRSNEGLTVRSRHLGLVQACEQSVLQHVLTSAADAAAEGIDLEDLMHRTRITQPAKAPALFPPLGQRIAIASDEAFGFIYPHLLSDWNKSGAELSFFSPLADEAPGANCNAIYLPGGYPELNAGTIATAEQFRAGMQIAAGDGVAIYGECGGYMVLGEALIDEDGESHPMLGLLSHVTSFQQRKRQLGYRRLKRVGEAPLPRLLNGHEFHYSTIAEPGSDKPLFEVTDSKDAFLGTVGGCRNNVSGSYMHVIEAMQAA